MVVDVEGVQPRNSEIPHCSARLMILVRQIALTNTPKLRNSIGIQLIGGACYSLS